MDEHVVVAAFRIVFGVVVVLLYVDHARRTRRLYDVERGPRALRNFIISLMMCAGSVALVVTDLAFAIEPAAFTMSVIRFLLFVVRTTMLIGGIFLAWTWRRP